MMCVEFQASGVATLTVRCASQVTQLHRIVHGYSRFAFYSIPCQ